VSPSLADGDLPGYKIGVGDKGRSIGHYGTPSWTWLQPPSNPESRSILFPDLIVRMHKSKRGEEFGPEFRYVCTYSVVHLPLSEKTDKIRQDTATPLLPLSSRRSPVWSDTYHRRKLYYSISKVIDHRHLYLVAIAAYWLDWSTMFLMFPELGLGQRKH
jgi:hypothetical protein